MSGENRADIVGYTLFGDPVFAGEPKVGRPAFGWSEEKSHKVSLLLAMGWNNRRIADTFVNPQTGKPICVATLKTTFSAELKVRAQARDQLEARKLMAAAQAAFAGNMGALKVLEQLQEKNDRLLADATLGDRARKAGPPAAPAEDTPPAKRGKKEQFAHDAATAEQDMLARIQQEARNAGRRN